LIDLMTPAQITAAVESLESWRYDADRRALYRQLLFPGFPQALSAMMEIGFAAEQADHHPEWANVFDRLEIWLTTHDANGVSQKDFDLANIIDRLMIGRLR
jgi:4a-hydroxytetrahydrobiopterin dehydratase